jgi:hypothetical protein
MSKNLELIRKADQTLFSIHKNYLRKRGESGYWLYRFMRPILKVRYYTFRKLNDPCPWLSPSAVRFLNQALSKEFTGLEFGSGISSLFIAPKVKKLISVEHNKEWFSMISKKFETLGITNVDYRFIAQNAPEEFQNQSFEMEQKLNFKVRKDYVNYYITVNSIEDKSLDFLLVDGRARPECLYYALPKLKDKAIIILDNSEREHYKIVFELLKDYPMYNTTNGLTDTTFWFKGD